MLESERGGVTSLEREVVDALPRHETLAKDVEAEFDRQRWEAPNRSTWF